MDRIIIQKMGNLYLACVYKNGFCVREKPCSTLEWAKVWADKRGEKYGVPRGRVFVISDYQESLAEM